jgi:hypothetical protein
MSEPKVPAANWQAVERMREYAASEELEEMTQEVVSCAVKLCDEWFGDCKATAMNRHFNMLRSALENLAGCEAVAAE